MDDSMHDKVLILVCVVGLAIVLLDLFIWRP
jgi:hypothetical protein